jgi:hypothetical protein
MPDPTTVANAIFLPWVRQGAAGSIQTTDTLTASPPGRVRLPVKLRLNNAQDVEMFVHLLGPGDVTGIDIQQVVRTDPQPGTLDFEPNYFPAIEFDRPDFPWLFTPAKAGAESRLRPWLCLVVVKKQAGVTLRSEREAPLPILEINSPAKPGEELPDLSESWAWAHTQLSGRTNEPIAQTLANRPELNVSRLICPRKLEPTTEYYACVVPAFELGRKAGLNMPIEPAEETRLDAAWASGAQAPAQILLPVYYHWEFRTGVVGDFRSLALLLEARPIPPEVGKRPIDISQPGFRLPPVVTPGATLELEGALRVLKSLPAEGPAPAFQDELEKIVNAPAQQTGGANTAAPLLAPPIYGRWHAARNKVDNAPTPTWLDELNLDLRHRVVAGVGAQVIQDQQEQLMAAAWEQAGDVKPANQRLRQEQLNFSINASLHVRHISRLSEDGLFQIVAPAQSRVAWPDATANNAMATLQQRISNTALPLQATSGPVRRLARPRGVISRRVVMQGGARAGALVTKLSGTAISFQLPRAAGMVSFNSVSQGLPRLSLNVRYEVATADAVRAVIGRPKFRLLPEGQSLQMGALGPDNPDAANFRKAAIANLTKINPGKTGMIITRRPPLMTAAIKTAVIAQLDPAITVKARARASVQIVNDQRPDPLDQIMAAPDFPQPMYEALRDRSQDFLLPGLERVPPNTVTLLETNAKFVEAFMVGLNTEMARELLWRGYPTDQRGTYFRRFWDTRGSVMPQRDIKPPGDIAPIHGWGVKKLGDNMTGSSADGKLVLLIRGELLRRYPNAVIYAAEAVISPSGIREPGPVESYPVFRGKLRPDVTFVGFNLTDTKAVGSPPSDPGWFFVIQEQPTEPRFGLDVGTQSGTQTHLSVKAQPPASLPIPHGAVWGKNSAHMASITRQQSVRIAIHATNMIP